jgi:hypothetical protein
MPIQTNLFSFIFIYWVLGLKTWTWSFFNSKGSLNMKPICTDGGICNSTFKLIGIVLNHRVHDDILDLSD